MSTGRSGRAPETCPVDHSARQQWSEATRSTKHPSTETAHHVQPTSPRQNPGSMSWTSWLRLWSAGDEQQITSSSPTQMKQLPQSPSKTSPQKVGTERTISSIPRTYAPGSSAGCPANLDDTFASPNAETKDPEISGSGNWVYPSEAQFLSALRRKGHSARAADMSIVVPIHNAVNEQAWSQILEWEAPYPAPCGGPKLRSFSGDSGKLTPKARALSLLGYQRPFDRHDWVLDRCGTRIDYVIDFYSGKSTKEGRISFYLDVRPKLNTWEGARMRLRRGLGLVQP